ncbi:glycosyltransferase [Myxosarcina sp. GI1]|uniref:glycosyltransferase n=1 Tax=Myxosarcina sp. GI1 TaxID=1541065 RepID=UPI00056783BF|nr:glycosyltransferase [Myxosarcina sp. GI1]
MNKPWLSIIIPTYNGEKYLAAALDSVVAQQDSDIECVIVDDGSTDSSFSIVETYRDKLNLELVKRSRVGNWVANTNYGLSVASGEYACFLHQDDIWLPNRLKTMQRAIALYPQANFYLHSALFIDESGDRLGIWQCPLPALQLIEPNKMVAKLLVQNFIAIPAPIFKRQLALDLGSMDEQLWYTADWDFWLKLASVSQSVYAAEPLAAFRVHADSQTIRRSSSIEDFRQQMRLVVSKYLSSTEDNRAAVEKVAWFSTEVNTTLAAMVHGKSANLWGLLSNFATLGPLGWHRYWQDSRIQERVAARLKAKLQTSN